MDCYYCGREVRETTHTQKRYKVDYYLQHTGKTEWAFFTSLKEDAPTIRYLKLTHPIDIITCVQCYTQPEIRRCLDDDFVSDKSPLTFDQGPNHTTEIHSKG
jgi:hypothetical protein